MANDNAARLGIANCDFYAGKTERLLFYTLRQCDLSKTCLVLDPPRSGCTGPVMKNFAKQRPAKVICVSCAPPMLARDIKELVALGTASIGSRRSTCSGKLRTARPWPS